ncbi:CXL10 protein, partial [Amia calva]|nr:CXL10 protein [Amia calva]
MCRGRKIDSVQLPNIFKLELLPKSLTCDKVEIVVVLKSTREKKCLNPDSEFTKNLVKIMLKKR